MTQLQGSPSIKILVATMSGNARECAREAARTFNRELGARVELVEIEGYSAKQLLKEKGPVLVCTSTFGNGEPPDCAYGFWETLLHPKYPPLTHLHYSVLALGDSTYPKFCLFGKELDDRLRRLGAHSIAPQISCDVDYEEPCATWIEACVKGLRKK